jgi:hypothetical protein
MVATARQIPLTDDDLAGSSGGAFAELDVPGDYEATLTDVNDYDKTAEGKSKGWVFEYEVETPSGATVPFSTWLSFGLKARWKMVEVLEAHDADLSAGLNDVDPNAHVGDVIGVHIDFPRDKDTDEPTSQYRELRAHFSLAEEPSEEAVAEVTAVVAGTPDII